MSLQDEAARASHASIMSHCPSGRLHAACRGLALARVTALVALLASAAGIAAAAEPATGPAAAANPAAALVESSARAMRTDPDVSRRDAERALAQLERTPDADLAIRAHLLLCDYQSERDSEAAEREIAAATALLSHARRQGLRAGVLLCQGAVDETAGRTGDAMSQYEQAVAVANRSHDEEMLAEALFLRGYLFGVQGQYAQGLADLEQARALYEKLAKPLHVLTTLDAVASLYVQMGDYAQARTLYTQALAVQRGARLLREQAVTLHNLGRANEKLHDWAAARAAFAESLAVNERINYTRGEAYALRGLAAVSNASGDPQGALETLERADALQRQTPDARLHAWIELARGVALHRLKRLEESITALQDATRVLRDADAMGELNVADAELAAVYADAGNWREAYSLERKVRSTSEQLLENQIDQRFATLKLEFDTAAQQREYSTLLRENAANQRALAQGQRVRSLQGVIIVLGALLASLLALLAVFQYRTGIRMRSLAMTDELTRLPNRRAVLARLEQLLRGFDRRPCAALIVDIDHFKEINDRHGHPVGDEVLRAMAAALRESVDEPAFFGRLGGEEFLIVLPNTTLEAARAVAESFRERIASIDVTLGSAGRGHITASIGVSDATPGRDTPSSLLRRADAALYAAKRGGRNCVRIEPAELAEAGQLALDV
jgi:diguanylate cyclase (GGDEF)-like protein